jgi:hypothetical protein
MNINPADETSYTTQYEAVLLTYVENEYCTKHRSLPAIEPYCVPTNNLISSAMAPSFGQSCYDPYDLSCTGEEYLMPKNAAQTPPGPCNHAGHLLTPARPSFNSLPELPQNWGQINLNHNDHHYNAMAIRSSFSIVVITDWWH